MFSVSVNKNTRQWQYYTIMLLTPKNLDIRAKFFAKTYMYLNERLKQKSCANFGVHSKFAASATRKKQLLGLHSNDLYMWYM